MKNKLKKVVAYVLSFMMLFTMSAMNISSVSAASTGSITVHTGKHDVNGVNFNAYRLMDATVSGNKVSYSISSNFTGFFTEELLNGTTGDDIDIKAYNYIKANVSTTDFQNKLKTYIETNQISADGAATGTTARKEYTINGLAYGYYAVIPSGEGYTPSFTTVKSSAAVDVYLKGKTPDPEKTINNKKYDSAQVGDTVDFKVESMVPNMTGYNQYYYIFKDTMTEGLTVSKSTLKLVVKIGGTVVDTSEYTLTVDETNRTFTVEFKNFYTNHAKDANESLTFTYSAVVNEKAINDTNTSTNKAEVSYGNDPNHLTTGAPSEVKVLTHTLKINKVDEQNKPLSGAVFALYRNNVDSGKLKFVDEGNGTYRISSARNPSKFLNLDANYTNISVANERNNIKQQFKFVKVGEKKSLSDGHWRIVSKLDNNKTLNVDIGGRDPWNVTIWDNANVSQQQWEFEYDYSKGAYRIKDKYYNLYLSWDPSGLSTSVRSMGGYHTGAYWVLEYVGDGYYIFKNYHNQNMVLDLTNSNTKNGSNIIVNQKSNSNNQKFRIFR